MKEKIRFELNGKSEELQIDPESDFVVGSS